MVIIDTIVVVAVTVTTMLLTMKLWEWMFSLAD